MAKRQKFGGRVSGTPNKRTTKLQELLEERFPGWCPVVQMAALAQDTEADMGLRVTCCKEVAQYLYPKRKAIEHSGDGGGLISFRMVSND